MILPNFVMCGAARAGGTSLVKTLGQHPDIHINLYSPEPHFFYYTWKMRKGLTWYSNTYFNAVRNETAIGEKSSSYMFGEHVPGNIYKHLTTTKFIFLLRNPVDRAYSNYKFTKEQGLEPHGFEYAIENEDARTKELMGPLAETMPFSYIGRSRYYKQLMRFIRTFGKERMLLLKSEEMFENAWSILQKIYRFLGVSDFAPQPVPPNASPPGDPLTPSVRKRAFKMLEGDMWKLTKIIDFNIEDWNA